MAPPGANRVTKKHPLSARLYVAFPQTSAFAIEGFLLPLLAVFGVAGQTTLQYRSWKYDIGYIRKIFIHTKANGRT